MRTPTTNAARSSTIRDEPRVAIELPETLDITDGNQTNQPCRFCGAPGAADPGNLDACVGHLAALHGYWREDDQPHQTDAHTTIRLRLIGWSPRAKFKPDDRVQVNDQAPADYRARRGTILAWHADQSAYYVSFDDDPLRGWLPADWLDTDVKPSA